MLGPALVALATALAGCAELTRVAQRSMPGMRAAPTGFTEEDLRQALADFSGSFASVLAGTSELLREENVDREVLRRALLVQMNAVPLVQELVFQPDVQQAYVSTLTLVVMLRQFVTDGAGRESFGDQQRVIVGAVEQLEASLLQTAERFLDPRQVALMREEVESFARTRPIQPGFAVQGIEAAVAAVPRQGTFSWLIDLPMSPFRALEGVSSGAAAIRDFNQTALQLTNHVALLPQQIRWQMELLLYDVEDRHTVVETLALMRGIEESADRASRAVEGLPGDLATSLEASRGALADANRTIEQARALVAALDPTVERIRATGEVWTTLVRGGPEASQDREPGRPFDIREWESAAREISQAATSLQTLAVELRTLSEVEPNQGTVAELRAAADGAEQRARGLLDLAFWRLGALILFFFALLALYRVTFGRPGGSAGRA